MFNLANNRNSLARSTKSTRSWLMPLSLLVNTRFQILFHSPPGVLFTFPSRYLFAIGHQVVFSLRGWSPCVPTGFLVSCGTLLYWLVLISPTRLLLSLVLFPVGLAIFPFRLYAWALSRSLAATWNIEVSFFSSGYLDVSVLPVRFSLPMCSVGDIQSLSVWVFPFGDLRFIGYLLLPAAFRSLSRPSSPLGA